MWRGSVFDAVGLSPRASFPYSRVESAFSPGASRLPPPGDSFFGEAFFLLEKKGFITAEPLSIPFALRTKFMCYNMYSRCSYFILCTIRSFARKGVREGGYSVKFSSR